MRRWVPVVGVVALAVAIVAGAVLWRYQAPVRVSLNSQVVGEPLEVVPVPAVLDVPPGKMQRVVFRVHNPGSEVRRLKGSLALAPRAAQEQVEVFAMQCGDLAIVEPGETTEFAVVFRVDAAGLEGQREIKMRHIFQPAEAGP